MLEKTHRIHLLYDFYHALLTEKQRTYLQLYYDDDFSLSEIAEEQDVSRQAIYDHIKRAEQQLEQFEQDLQLLQKHHQREELIEQALQLTLEDQADLSAIRQLLLALKKVD